MRESKGRLSSLGEPVFFLSCGRVREDCEVDRMSNAAPRPGSDGACRNLERFSLKPLASEFFVSMVRGLLESCRSQHHIQFNLIGVQNTVAVSVDVHFREVAVENVGETPFDLTV